VTRIRNNCTTTSRMCVVALSFTYRETTYTLLGVFLTFGVHTHGGVQKDHRRYKKQSDNTRQLFI